MNLSKYFIKGPLIPAVVQDAASKEVLMLAYMNEESLAKTLETGYTWFFSRSRNELWNKGATSGHTQRVVSITGDCDDDTLLILVEQKGPACHTGNKTCFYKVGELPSTHKFGEASEENAAQGDDLADESTENALSALYEVVLDRSKAMVENSYTCYLFQQGLDKILKKCGEECSEVIIAAKNLSAALDEEKKQEVRADVKNELCDLLYHLTVLMVSEGIPLEEIYDILRERSAKIGNLKKFKNADHNS